MGEIDWRALETSDGPATDAPELLRRLTTGTAEEEAAARAEFWVRYWSRDRWFTAQPRFAGALLAHAFEGRGANRPRALELAVEIASRGTGDKLAGNIDAAMYREPIGEELVTVLRSRSTDAIAALSDPDESMRARAASMLMFAAMASEPVLAAMSERLVLEPCAAVRATLAHALGVLSRGSDGPGLTVARSAIAALHADPSPVVRAFSLAGELAGRSRTWTAEVCTALAAGMLFPRDHRIPWKGGAVDEVLPEIAFDVAGQDAVVDLLLAAIDVASANEAERKRIEAWSIEVATLAFGGRTTFRRPTTVTARQREIATHLARRAEAAAGLRWVGLPTKPSVLHAWLDVDGTSPLTSRVRSELDGIEIEETLWWTLLHACDDEADDDALQAIQRALPDEVLLEARAALELLDPDGDFTKQDFGLDALVEAIERLGATARSWAERTLEGLHTKGASSSSFATLCFLAAARGMAPDETWPERWDVLIDPRAHAHEVYDRGYEAIRAHWPAARREPVFLAYLARRTAFAAVRLVPHLRDCPSSEVASALLACVDEEDCEEAGEVVEALRAVAVDHVAIGDAVRAYQASAEPLRGLLARGSTETR